NIGWHKEGKALDVIPVEVTEQEGSLSSPPTKGGTHEFIAKNSQACATVQNQQIIGVPDCHARRISPVFYCTGVWCRNRAPYAVVLDLHF
ncbi:MAG: hypothetical protein JSV01_08615, partial [Desulfobacterales bacterium]